MFRKQGASLREGVCKRNADKESASNMANSYSLNVPNDCRGMGGLLGFLSKSFYSRLYVIVVMASWLLSAHFLAAQEVQVYEVNHIYFKVTDVRDDDVLNIRAGPSAQYDIVGRYFPRESLVEVLGVTRDQKWALVNISEGVGWTSMRYLAPISPVTYKTSNVPFALRCSGGEPNWMATLGRKTISFSVFGSISDTYRLESVRAYRNPWTVTLVGGNASSVAFDIRKDEQLCSNEAGNLFPWFVDAFIAESTYTGCCSLDW